MIDFHCHILPGVDDGSKDMEQTTRMLQEAKKAGFDAIIATPHYIEEAYFIDSFSIEKIVAAINNFAEIPLYVASEAYVNMKLVKLIQEGKISMMNHSHYLLFELPMNLPVIYLEELLYELQAADIIPVIAHPERYSYVQENPNIVGEWMEKGAYFQANYGSIIGQYGKTAQKTVKKLLTHGGIQFLGTDCHRSHSIYEKMPEILTEMRKVIGEEKLRELSHTNPKKVLEDETIEKGEMAKIHKFF